MKANRSWSLLEPPGAINRDLTRLSNTMSKGHTVYTICTNRDLKDTGKLELGRDEGRMFLESGVWTRRGLHRAAHRLSDGHSPLIDGC